LLRSLADPNEARNYLNAVLEDYPEGFLKALRNVASARRMTKVAEVTGIKRESLYRALSHEGNPTLETLTSVLTALGLKMSIEIAVKESPGQRRNPQTVFPRRKRLEGSSEAIWPSRMWTTR
jgi:probable addiction module antidote protein